MTNVFDIYSDIVPVSNCVVCREVCHIGKSLNIGNQSVMLVSHNLVQLVLSVCVLFHVQKHRISQRVSVLVCMFVVYVAHTVC